MIQANDAAMAVNASCGDSRDAKKNVFTVSYSESVKSMLDRIAQMTVQVKASFYERVAPLWPQRRSLLLQQAKAIVDYVNEMDEAIFGFSCSDTASMGGTDVLLGQQADAAWAMSSSAAADTPYINEREWLLEGLDFVHLNRGVLAARRAIWVYWRVLRERGQLTRISTSADLARSLRKLLSEKDGTRGEICGADSVEPSHVFKHVPDILKNAPTSQWEAAARDNPALQKYVTFAHEVAAFVEKKLINVPPHR